jgi:hypothetical protein
MIRLTAILIIVSSLFIFSCRHDTSELGESADVNDLSFTDIGKDIYNHRDVNLSDLEEIRDLSEDIIDIKIDIEEDVGADGEDAGDTENLDDIFDAEDAGGEEIFDISDISDIIPDAACSNQCAKSGEKECYQYQNKWYVRECKDTNSDGCLEWENVAFCSYGCENGECKSCVPDCTNKECGDDGCGGSCGSCGTNAICSNGSCACNSGYGNCDGLWSNGCEVSLTNNSNNCGSCGNSCGANATCNNGICICTYLDCNGVCCDAEQVCFNNSCCTPNCVGKECGYDGCGGSCGDCGPNEQCKAGICQPINP